MHRRDFGDDFWWGAATSAFQVEGATAIDGRGPSIWDEFSRSKRGLLRRRSAILGGQTADVACDHYHRYPDDVALLGSLNVNAYRLSISWPRLLPEGVGPVNPLGLDFYKKLLDALGERDISPFVTLYHWDLPQALELRGGWTNREVVQWFADFAAGCADALGSRVRHWIVINEGLTFTGLGHFFGTHAPGRRRLRNFLPAMHHCMLAQAEAARRIRELQPAARIGTSVAVTAAHPKTERERDRGAAARVAALCRAFVDPVVGRGYPVDDLPFLGKIERRVARPGDLERIRFPLDFLGINHYSRMVLRNSALVPYLGVVPVTPRGPGVELAANGWEVYPAGMYEVLRDYGAYPEIPELLVTENGAAFEDVVTTDGSIDDASRRSYLERYLAELLRARRDGVNVRGYFVWSLLDNFEWDRGYADRFGLVHVDHASQRRTLKASGRWYRDFLAG